MFMLLLLIFLGLVFFFVVKFATVVTTMVAIVVGVTTISIFASIWLGTSYYLKQVGYEPKTAQQAYHQVDSDLKQIVGDLQEIRSQLEDAEPHLRNVEFLRYARQNSKGEEKQT